MRIGIDARMLGPACGGLGRYVEQLVIHLEKSGTSHQVVLFMRSENWESFVPSTKNVHKVLVDIPWYSVREQIYFSRYIHQAQVDVMHWPHWNVPIGYTGPLVLTVHDLIMFHYPREEASTHGRLVYRVKDQVARLVLRQAVKKAKKIIVTSEFTREDVHTSLGVAREKMMVTYQAPFEVIHNTVTITNQSVGLPDIRKPFVLYVGNMFPHKNIDGLLKAWQVFVHRYGSEYQLVLAGPKNFFSEQIRQQVLCEQIPNVVMLGFVNDEQLAILYGQARLYVFPSLYEGFGIPPLEAMSHGVPVVSSNRSCLPEILGEAALYVDPENIEQMADAIYRGLTDESIRYELISRGREELQRYSWDILAKKTLAIYESISLKT